MKVVIDLFVVIKNAFMEFGYLILPILVVVMELYIWGNYFIRKRARICESYPEGFIIEDGKLKINNVLKTSFLIQDIKYVEFSKPHGYLGFEFAEHEYCMRIYRKNGKKSLRYVLGTNATVFEKQANLIIKYNISINYVEWPTQGRKYF